MAFRYCDSFDHYVTAEISLKWTQQFSASIQSVIVRNGPNAMFFPSGLANAASVSKTLDYQSTWICGWAVYLPNSSSGLATGGIIYTLVSNGTPLMTVGINTDSTMSLAAPGAGTFFTTALSLHFNVWYYIEIKNVLSTVGSNVGVTSELRVNGISQGAQPTQTTNVTVASLLSGATANRHIFGGVIGDPSGFYIDDLYICDGQTGVNNTFLGDVAIEALFPDADSTPLNFSIFPTSPTTHYTKVNENPPDGDSSYIYDNNPGDQDNFDWQPIASFTGTIPAVQYLLYARKDDEGTRTIKHTIGGSTYAPGTGGVLGTPAFSLSDDYVYYHIPLDTDPATSVPWSVADFNAETFGVEVFS